MLRYLVLLFCFVLSCLAGSSQSKVFRIDDDEMILQLDRRWSKSTIDSILNRFDMKQLSVDSAWRFGSAGILESEGWRVRQTAKNKIEVFKPVSGMKRMEQSNIPLVLDQSSSDSTKSNASNSFTDAIFGRNDFESLSISEGSDGATQFFLAGRNNAKSVMLSGSFNNWSTSGIKMTKVENGWMAKLRLIPGRYEYKFIVDGKWMRDPANKQRVSDNVGDFNSVYFKTNYSFRLKVDASTKKVVVAGTFNNWHEFELEMKQVGDYRVLDVYLPDGTYQYKFIVDGKWQTDPENRQEIQDADGNVNSSISIGTPSIIKLAGHLDANKVVLAGTFNGWSESQLVMKKVSVGWELPIVLRPGYYEYKFIIDGKWSLDDTQPEVLYNTDDQNNNFTVIHPNHFFRVQNSPEMKSVLVTGSFCDWREQGFPLQLSGEEWTLPFFLEKGKHTYKFIINGEWKLDSANPNWEENEFGSGNSVLWIN